MKSFVQERTLTSVIIRIFMMKILENFQNFQEFENPIQIRSF